jgi:imidazolonepropionase-like amidohydrolase
VHSAADVAYWKPNVNFFSRYRTPIYIRAQKADFEKEKQLVGDMNRAGVGILAGTDSTATYVIPGFSLHDELALLVECGLTPMQALQTATRNAAEYLGELAQQGTIEKGKRADLILLDRDPLANIRNTTSINAVIQRGHLYSRPTLDNMLSEVETLARQKK